MRRLAAATLGSLLLASGFAFAPSQATEDPAEWKGTPTYVSGTARYDKGEWIYTDFVYDDYGADTGEWRQPQVVSLAATAGDARYPVGAAFRDNAADIVEVRARVRGRSDLEVRVLLQTLLDPSVTALWVRAGSDDPRVITETNSTMDAGANTVTFTLPGVASGRNVSLNIGAGLHDGGGGLRAGRPGNQTMFRNDITTGGPTENRLFDLAFNTNELEGRGGTWNEERQSAALALGELSSFAQEIDLTQLANKRPGKPVRLEPGYYVRIFESRMNTAEGMGASLPQYGGTWQPYALWIPKGHDPSQSAPLYLNLHSLSAHHNQYRGGRSSTYRTLYEQMGDELGAIVVTPLGRGPDGWYLNEAFIDTLEVWSDVLRAFSVDRERVLLGGYSMGGYGTYRLATLMPDAFASAVSVVGPPTNGIWAYPLPASGPYFTHPQLENTRNIPFWITHGVLDELVPVSGVQQQANRLAALGHEHRFALHPAEDHLSFAVKDNWSRETAWHDEHPTRVTDPERVTFKVRPASWLSANRVTTLTPLLSELLAEVGGRLDGAYWVADVVTTGTGDVTGTVDLASGGVTRRNTGTTSILGAGIDGPSPYRLTGTTITWSDAAAGEDVLRGSLARVSALTVDVGRAGLSDDPALAVAVDGPVVLTLVRDGAVVRTVTLTP